MTPLKLSFCVPVYNRANSLRRCLESLLDQSMPDQEYEIVVVDDGSTDGSADVARTLFMERGFAQGRVYRLPGNSGGASVPRNAAVGYARGEFMFFVDSDDYVSVDLADRIHACATQNRSDVVYVRYGVVGDGLLPPKGFSGRGNRPLADLIKDHLLYATMVHKAFRRSEWERLGIVFDSTIRVYEDMLATVSFLMGTTRYSVLADQEYYFLTNQEPTRLHEAAQSIDATFDVYARVLDAIAGGSTHDTRVKLAAGAVIVSRVMAYGPASAHSYLRRDCPSGVVRQWMDLWQSFLVGHLPQNADQFINPRVRRQAQALRIGSVLLARAAATIERFRTTNLVLARVLGRGFDAGMLVLRWIRSR
jgi:glycosyltransferase involved in cell wall biosynthesis